MDWVLIVGLLLNAIALPIAGRRVWWLVRLITSGQPAPDRVAGVTGRIGTALRTQLVEVFGQQKLLKWTVPGAAHFFVFWAFVILATVYLEAYGVLLVSDTFAIPLIGHWEVLGFAQDTIALLALVSLAAFSWIRIQQAPAKLGRRSRFKGSHLGGAWLVLFMIVHVIWTMFLFRGAASALGNLPYDSGAFVAVAVGNALDGLSEDALHTLEGIGLLLHIGVMLVFLVIVLNSKHLHIFTAPLNVLFKRQPVALGAAKPLMSDGRPVHLDDIEDMDEDTTLGIGAVEDFSWKGMLDFATCTECGRCQDQCPAWNTEKPLSPKLMIMALRDHAFAKGDHILAPEGRKEAVAAGSATITKELERPLVGDTGEEWFYMPEDGSGVIDPDVLWSCVTCGACVQQCPVDIEHVDHIVDMRRYQVLVESNFPAELNQLFKGMESKGNPWNLSPNMRMDWAQGLDFEVPVVGEDLESLDSVDWLFWVGCAGAYEDRAKKTTRAVAELLDLAGVSFGVLGKGETCTGDSARRAGNEFVFQGLAQQNIEAFKEFKVKKVVSTCAHCFNTLKNEYREFGIELEVVHHTQLLNRLVREGRLTPVTDGAGAQKRSITYHDPCYIGRHNQVYEPPRELLQVLPGAEYVEMERNSERSFCCGAGGARMWMEETIGERINVNRTTEAVGTGADQIAVGCPFCRVMLSDGLTALQDSGDAREEVEVLDVAQMLLASVKGESATRARKSAAKASTNGAPVAAAGAATTTAGDEAVKDEPEPGDATQTEGTLTETSEVGPAARASGGGGSLFDLGEDDASSTDEASEASADDTSAAPEAGSGGSLFDLGGDEPEPEPEDGGVEKPDPADVTDQKAPASESPEPDTDLGTGGSLFDIAPTEPAEPAEPAAETPSATELEPADTGAEKPDPADVTTQEDAPASEDREPDTDSDLGAGGSLFDIAPSEPAEPAEPPASTPEPVEESAAAPAEETAAESGAAADLGGGKPDPDALSRAATAAAGSDRAADAEAAEPETNEPVEGEATEEAEEPQPTSRGEAHRPKTDVDIDDSGSLFDL